MKIISSCYTTSVMIYAF